ncbi:thiamine pyrophosphate-binding protein [Rhodoplanes sp. Z2-YC6860]|uniref:thiamine pyrophosphate-binding protein n=1 Tax=Rhodoplanes sp. Z2-YC6860 TaxID=674703 RepID=UPI00078B9A3B|nr:thiamine pyrophosphate-binding protein [Rhodoplanes sp. Z2-YC6860]AMN43894.1 acetolactate synthase [Rhodoplanes sp. Z2-YC6860]
MNNADLIVATLKAAGIRRGFGIPSGNVLPLMEAMRKGGVDFVLTAHEGSAGFAADVTGRMSGAPGLCIATLGPGATNLTTGVGNAWLDRSPMIAITCNLVTEQLGRRIQMWIDHHALFKPITKASFRLEKGKIVETINEAVRIAMSEPRGPVHLDLPEDVALAPAKEELAAAKPATSLSPASDAAIAKAHELIAKAKRPIAVLGSTAMRLGKPDLLRQVIERHNLPFATTTMAKGMIDEDHPLSIGVIERACRQHQRKLLRSADLIVGLGYDTIEVEYEAWIAEVPLLQIDMDKVDVAPSVNVAHEVTGDLDHSLGKLATLPATTHDWTPSALAEHRRAFHAALRPASNTFTAHAAIDAVRRALPREGLLSFDVGAHTHQIASQWTAYTPKSFHVTNGWSSMGFGLPGAIAAKLARPDLPVVCLIGDGCFQMTCGEVAVAKRMGLALPIVVLDDKWLALIKVKQIRRQFPLYGTDLQEEEYTEPPQHYFGVPAVGARSPETLENAVKAALKAKGPTVIEAVVDSDHYVETVYD